MLTARTFAKEKGVSYTTIMAWLRDGLVPGAAQEETPMGKVWQIPASSLERVERRKPGPKPLTGAGGRRGMLTGETKPKRRASKRLPAGKANATKSAKQKGARAK